MAEPVEYPVWQSPPPAIVEYNPEHQILFIWTGEKSAAGEEMAKDITVHYDKDEDNERCSAVAIHVDSAEHVLKPFVDAILAKYGVKREEEPDVAKETTKVDAVPGN